VGIPVIERAKIQAQVLVPLVKALQAELGEERANALVRKALGDVYRRLGEQWWRAKQSRHVGENMTLAFASFAKGDAVFDQDVTPFDAVPPEPFCTVTVKLPAADKVAVPTNCVDVLVVSELLAIVQGVHPGPVNDTNAVFGSKPVPAIVKVIDCPATGGFGVVVIVVIWGAAPLPLDTVTARPLEGAPLDPFCTVTVKLPALSVAAPLNPVDVLLVSAVFVTPSPRAWAASAQNLLPQ